MKNKNGFVVSGLTTILLYFGFILLIIIFFFIFKLTFGEHEVQISGYVDTADTDYQLLNYLRTPYLFEGRMMNIAEMITILANEKDSTKKEVYYQEILKITKEILNPIEYCYLKPGTSDKVIVGYGVFLLDEDAYGYNSKLSSSSTTSLKTDRVFRTDHFTESLTKLDKPAIATLPNYEGGLLHIGLIRTTQTILRIKPQVQGIPGCG